MTTTFRYLDTREDLIKLAASLHLLPAKPDAIMIDDIGSFRAYPPPLSFLLTSEGEMYSDYVFVDMKNDKMVVEFL